MKNLFRLNTPPNRVFGLDLMRAMAILFVMISHAELQLPESLKAVNRLFYFDGVLIFFVLSGFLIGNIFIRQLEENGQDGNVLLRFWKRRWLRTLPAYLFILILLIILSRHSNPEFPLSKVWKYFLFVQNINDARGLFFFGESWSLAVEEWFYLLMPVFTLALMKIFNGGVKKTVLAYFIITITGSFLIRHFKYQVYQPQNIKDWADYFKDSINTRFDSLSFGVLGAYLSYYHKQQWIRFNHSRYAIIGLAGFFLIRYLALFGVIERESYFNCNIAFTLNSVLIFITLPFFSNMGATPYKLFNNVVAKTSLISYSIYLLNLSVVTHFIINKNRPLMPIGYPLFWVLTIVLSVLMYKYIEAPFLKLREKGRHKG